VACSVTTTEIPLFMLLEVNFKYWFFLNVWFNKNNILLLVGANVKEESDLQYLYESHEHFSSIPTYAVLPSLMATMSSSLITEAIPGREFDLSQV